MKTAVVSNKVDFAVRQLAEDYFPGLFDIAVGEREGVKRKPAPDSVLAVMDALGVRREETVYIGDSDVDVETAKNAGVDLIGVSTSATPMWTWKRRRTRGWISSAWSGDSARVKCCSRTARKSP